MILADTHDDGEAEAAAIRVLRSRRVDGVLLTPSADAPASVLPELRRLGVPVVLVDRVPEHTGVDQVGPENVQATSDLVRHLGELGHRRIAMISGPQSVSTSAERVLGYRLGLGRAKLVWDQALVALGRSRRGGRRAGSNCSTARTRRPRVVAGDNTALIEVLRVARERGLAIGKDLAVVAHDDADWTALVDPAITTTAQPLAQIGATAVRMLLERIANTRKEPETVRIPPILMHRQSCGCA